MIKYLFYNKLFFNYSYNKVNQNMGFIVLLKFSYCFNFIYPTCKSLFLIAYSPIFCFRSTIYKGAAEG